MQANSLTLCRCCGSLHSPENLINFETLIINANSDTEPKTLKMVDWFLEFTSLDSKTYRSEYNRICKACETKLLGAFEFRQSLLVAEETFANEAIISLMDDQKLFDNEDPITVLSDNDDDETMDFDDCSIALPKGLRKLQLPDGLKVEMKPVHTTNEEGENETAYEWSIVPTKEKFRKSCSKCKKIFSSQSGLSAHMRTHEIVYDCDDCFETFTTKYARQLHRLKHIEEQKPLVCQFCGKRYDDKELYQLHLKAHEEATQEYSCEECGKVFILAQSAQRHDREFHPEETCKLCNQLFTKGRDFRLHLLQHGGVKFICDLCDSLEFTNHTNLIKHLKQDHDGVEFSEVRHLLLPVEETVIDLDDMEDEEDKIIEKPFSCDICKDRFVTKTRLKQHMITKHKIEKSVEENRGVVVVESMNSEEEIIECEIIDMDEIFKM